MSSSDLSETPDVPHRRRKRKNYSLLILAAGIFLFGMAAGTLYLVLRPVTLRIAVGPPGSDDQKLIQAVAPTFCPDQSPISSSADPTKGTTRMLSALGRSKTEPTRQPG